MDFTLYDAHSHLPDNHSQYGISGWDKTRLVGSIINGVSPDDWSSVFEFTRKHSQTRPAIGLHPHSVYKAPNDWKKIFLELLDNNPICAIGEIGLDRRDPYEKTVEQQLDAFCWQLEQAHIRNLPVSIHCVKAIGLLMETLRSHDLPPRGIHLHAYAGPVELIPELDKLGAYFSFSARQLASQNAKVRDRICAVPTGRLLIETDEMFTDEGSSLVDCYTIVTEILGISIEQLAMNVEENFKRYFLAG